MFKASSVQLQETEKKGKSYGTWDFNTLDVQYPSFFKSDFDLLVSQLPDIVENFFRTPEGAMDLTFQLNYDPDVYHVYIRKNIAKTVAQI